MKRRSSKPSASNPQSSSRPSDPDININGDSHPQTTPHLSDTGITGSVTDTFTKP